MYTFLWNSLEKENLREDDRKDLYEFWCDFFEKVETGAYSFTHTSRSHEYKDKVIEILEEGKAKILTREDLEAMQSQIEDLTMKFDEGCLYKTEPNLVKMLIRENQASAKDYIRKRTKVKQAEVEELLAEFGQYTLEGILVHVLSKVFFVGRGSDESLVRLPALVERLEESVRMEAFLLKCRRSNKKISEGRKEFLEKYLCEEGKKGSLYDAYPFGIALLEFMEERGLISLTTNFKESVRVRKKANYYLPKSLYVLNNFDLSLLPMKLNLPMICLPVLWNCSKNTSAPITFSDLTGGYLNALTLTGEIYDRYSLMSSKNPKLY